MFFLPGGGGDNSWFFMWQVDSRRPSKTKLVGIMSDQIDPYFQPNLIKIDITGFDNGPMKAYCPMPPFFPTPEIPIPIRINTGARHLCVRGDDPRFQPRNGSDDFEY
jgi:hypothetical protein